ncbi:hypothetical protein OH77DRAFT_1100867 [Trametes cingulata]|nr:hypothetical protein OH77DRAFT_1100867 [Trametes cingulata]
MRLIRPVVHLCEGSCGARTAYCTEYDQSFAGHSESGPDHRHWAVLQRQRIIPLCSSQRSSPDGCRTAPHNHPVQTTKDQAWPSLTSAAQGYITPPSGHLGSPGRSSSRRALAGCHSCSEPGLLELNPPLRTMALGVKSYDFLAQCAPLGLLELTSSGWQRL